MKNQSVAWRVNGLPLPKNPSTFIVNPEKIVDYRRAVHGEEIRVVPSKNTVDKYISVSWQYLDEDTRNLFYDLYVRDEKFRLETHLDSLYTDEFLVKIDEYDEEYLNYREPRWHVSMELRVLDGINDPILRQEFKQTPHLFVVENKTNSTIHNANIFLSPKNVIRNPRITQTFWNLLTNPGFEDIDGQKPLGWVDPNGAWRVDIINFFEGQRCVGTSTPNSPIYQEVWCPGGESLTVMFATLGLPGGGKLRATLEYLNSSDAVIGSHSAIVDVDSDHKVHWFTTDEATPPYTRKVRLKFEKASTDYSYIIVDMAMVRLGASEREPVWTNDRHRTLVYPGSLKAGEILDVNLGLQVATLHTTGPALPVGASLFRFDDSLASIDGQQPLDGYVATMRPDDGRFSGAVAVEETTENLLPESAFDSLDGLEVVNLNRWSRARRITRTSGNLYNIVDIPCDADTEYTMSIYARAVRISPGSEFRIYMGDDGDSPNESLYIQPGSEWQRYVLTRRTSPNATRITRASIHLERLAEGDIIEIADWQLEAKPFATSFTDDARPDGRLAYRTHLSSSEGFAVRFYIKRVG